MASLPPNATQDEIEEEVEFTGVLILSLDPGADDYYDKLAQLETKKGDLERRLYELQTGGSQPQTVQGQGQGQGYRQVAGMDSSDERPSWWQFPPVDDHLGINDIQDGVSSYDSSFNTTWSGMKRPLPDSIRLESEHASKRPTPEPSNVPTPSTSVESFEIYDNAKMDVNERARRRQLAAEAAYKREREKQLADEQLARTLSRPQSQPRMNGAATSSSQRPTFQTTLNTDGSYDRPPPPKPVKSEQPFVMPQRLSESKYEQPFVMPQRLSESFTPQFTRNIPPPSFGQQARMPYAKPAMSPYIKPESSVLKLEQPSGPRRPPDVVDLTGSDSDEDDEEDVAEIAPNGFTPSSRSQRPALSSPLAVRTAQPQRQLYPPMTSSRATPPIPGAFPTEPWSNHSLMPGGYPTTNQNPYQSVYGNLNASLLPQNLQQQPNPLLASAMNSARNAARSLLNPLTQLPNSIYGSYPLPNLESGDDDLLFVGSQQRPPGQQPYAGYDDRDLYLRRYNELADYNPEKTKEEINALLENIRPDEDIPADLRVKTPEAMTIKLHKYQELGLTWLKQCEEGSNKGGVLGDEMGLGKTIQMLSLIVERKSEDPRCKTTLIVAPVALMRQWKQEIEQKIKPGKHRLEVYVQHGQSRKKSFQELRYKDIVLTTYGMLASEMRKEEKFRLRLKHDPGARRYPKEQCAILGEDAKWYRVILDEAQCIKNKSTQTAQAAGLINAKYRFCMTGTPMMNNVEEFFSLVKFLNINPYCRWDKFRVDISAPLKSGNENGRQAAMYKLQALCKAIMLRRTKKSTFEGKPILILPERTTEVENPEFDDDEKEFYRSIENKTQLQFNKYLKRGQVGTHYSAILVLLLRLRQAACHPHLIKDFGIAAAADITQEQVINFSKQLEPQVVERIKATGGNFECPVCYDAVANPAIFIPCGHDTCRECFTRITDPANGIRDGNENGTGAKCPNCRGPIDTKRVTDFDAFKKVHMPELLTEEEKRELEQELKQINGEEDEDSGTESSGDDEDEDDDEVDEKGNLKKFVVDDDVDEDDEEIVKAEDSDTASEAEEVPDIKEEEGIAGPSKKPKNSIRENGNVKSRSKKSKGKQPKKEKAKKNTKNKAVTLADLAKLSQRNAKARKTYLRRLRENYVDSAKIRKTMELLHEIVNDAEGEKILVFSQWTSLLDLLEIPVDSMGWDYRRYDGSMNTKMRGDAVDDFRDHHKNVRIMLVSLKAGNAGLNLNMASQVIILDPFWNPYIEEQAIDRAHRIGQSRPVKVHRILVAETVEDRIIELQEKKRALISEALDEKAGQNIARLGVRELAYLFGVTRNPNQHIDYQPANRR